MAARKKHCYERGLPLHYTSYHFLLFLYPTEETIYYKFVAEFKNFFLTRILAYYVGVRADWSLLQTTGREGVSVFTLLVNSPCIFDMLSVAFDMTVIFRKSFLTKEGV